MVAWYATALRQPAFTLVNGHVPFDHGPEIARYAAGFTGREWLFRELDAWLADPTGRAFVIVGGPGTGKSAIAARLSQRSADAAAVHFCWAGNARTLDPSEFVASIVGALSERVPGYTDALAKRSPETLREDASVAFRELVVEPARNTPAPKSPQLLIVDALDEALLREGLTIADVLLTHAEHLPAWLRIVATTRPESRVLDRLRLLNVIELDAARADNFADVAAFIAKRLAEPRLSERVRDASAKLATRLEGLAEGNFLYAKMALDALEDKSLAPADLATLSPGLTDYYTKAFLRAFRDPERYAVEQAPILRCLAAAFAPVPFDLLRSAAGFDPETFNRRIRRLRPFLRETGEGVARTVGLFHRSISDWLIDAERAGDYFCDAAAGHEVLARVLGGDRRASTYSVRWLPRHLLALRQWDLLAALLADLEFLKAAWNSDQYEVLRYWATIERETPIRVTGAYKQALSNANGESGEFALARLMLRTGHLLEASELNAKRIEADRKAGDLQRLEVSLGVQAAIFGERRDHDGAMALLKETERICRELGNQNGLQISLGNQALILMDRNDRDGAMALLKEQERICRELQNQAGLHTTLGSQGLILKARHDLDGAMALHKEEERICRELGDLHSLRISLHNQSAILHLCGDLDSAMMLLKETERICREVGDLRGLQLCLGNQSLVLKDHGELDGAMALHKEAERICRELGYLPGLQSSLYNQARILMAQGDLVGAMALLKEQERICRELKASTAIYECLWEQSEVLRRQGRAEGALQVIDRCERDAISATRSDWLHQFLGLRSTALADIGQFDEALEALVLKEAICRELDNPTGLAWALARRAYVAARRGKTTGEVIAFLREAQDFAIAHKLPNPARRIVPETLDDFENAGMAEYAEVIRATLLAEPPDA